MDNTSFVNKVLLILYILVAFVPSLGAQDAALTQWFYLSLVNLISIGYIFFKRKEYNLSISSKVVNFFFIGSGAFLMISLLSMIKASMVSESIVAIMYLLVTLLSFVMVFIIVKQEPKKYFEFFVFLIMGATLIEAYQVFSYFVINNKEPRSNKLLNGLIHNYGNFNILAASLAMKFPFVLYAFVTFKKSFLKYGALSLLFLTICSILLIGARTAIFSSTILFTGILYYLLIKQKDKKRIAKQSITPLILVVLCGVFLSLNLNKIQKSKLNSFNDLMFTKAKKDLYKKGKLLKEVKVTNSSGRNFLWESAFIGFKNNPILGLGVGNWKISEKQSFLKKAKRKTAMSPKKVHNDYLQVLSETGILGFLIFGGFFLIITYLSIQFCFKTKEEKSEFNLIGIVIFASFLIYSLDALFNFPHERPPIQILFFSLIAFLLSLISKKDEEKTGNKIVFPVLFVFLVGSLLLSFKVFSSNRIQKKLQNSYQKGDMFKDEFDISYEKACEMLPSFPELDSRARPNEIVKAIFAINNKKDKEALEHLDKSINQSPFIAENYSFKAMIFFQGDKKYRNIDSALYYSKKAFDIQPSMKMGYNILRNIYSMKKDKANMMQTFNTFLSTVPNDVDSWIDKANYMKKNGETNKRVLQVIDTALLFNPSERKLKIYKNELQGIKKQPVAAINKIADLFNNGVALYKKNDFVNAKKSFLKVIELNPMHYSAILYMGLSELNLKQYKNAVYYFTKLIDAKQINTGYVEYNRGVAYYNLSELEKAMNDFQVSKDKGYVQANKMLEKVKKSILN